ARAAQRERHGEQLGLGGVLVATVALGIVERRGEGGEPGGEASALLDRGCADGLQVWGQDRRCGRGTALPAGAGGSGVGRCPVLTGRKGRAIAEITHRAPLSGEYRAHNSRGITVRRRLEASFSSRQFIDMAAAHKV